MRPTTPRRFSTLRAPLAAWPLLLLAALAATACSSSDRAEPGPMFTAEELLDLEDRLNEELEASQTRRCERPPLRGEPLEGLAEGDLIDLIEPEGEIARCLELAADLVPEASPAAEGEAPARERAEAIAQIEAGCQVVLETMQRAVSHQDACNPYLPGRRPQPETMNNVIRASHVVAVLGARARREGQVDQAAAALLDGLRFTQDLTRGGPDLAQAMVGVTAAEAFYQPLADLLDRSGYLPEPLLEQMERELTLLIEAEPHPREIFAGERALRAAEEVLGQAPREGETAEERPRPPSTEGLGLTEEESRTLSLLAFERLTRSQEAECPVVVSPRQCRLALQANAERFAQLAHQRTFTEVARLMVGRDRTARRELYVDILAGVATPDYGRYVDRYARRGFMLAALRLHVALRREVETTGLCASPDPLGGDRWGGLRTTSAPAEGRWGALLHDPYTGARLRVTADQSGALVLRSPAADELDEMGGAPRLIHSIDCGEIVRQIRRSRDRAELPPGEGEEAAVEGEEAAVEGEEAAVEGEEAAVEGEEAAAPAAAPPTAPEAPGVP